MELETICALPLVDLFESCCYVLSESWQPKGAQENHRSAHSHLLAENFLPFPVEGFSRRVLSAATEHVVFWTVQNLNCKTNQNPSIFIDLY